MGFHTKMQLFVFIGLVQLGISLPGAVLDRAGCCHIANRSFLKHKAFGGQGGVDDVTCSLPAVPK